jgi:hypothetical protein
MKLSVPGGSGGDLPQNGHSCQTGKNVDCAFSLRYFCVEIPGISCTSGLDTATCGAFVKKRRMNFLENNKLHGKLSIWGTLFLSSL